MRHLDFHYNLAEILFRVQNCINDNVSKNYERKLDKMIIFR